MESSYVKYFYLNQFIKITGTLMALLVVLALYLSWFYSYSYYFQIKIHKLDI